MGFFLVPVSVFLTCAVPTSCQGLLGTATFWIYFIFVFVLLTSTGSRFFLWFLIPSFFSPSFWGLFQVHRLQVVSPSPTRFTAFFVCSFARSKYMSIVSRSTGRAKLIIVIVYFSFIQDKSSYIRRLIIMQHIFFLFLLFRRSIFPFIILWVVVRPNFVCVCVCVFIMLRQVVVHLNCVYAQAFVCVCVCLSFYDKLSFILCVYAQAFVCVCVCVCVCVYRFTTSCRSS